jgi:hypothetical protein
MIMMSGLFNECAPMVSADGGIDLLEEMYPMEVEVIPKVGEKVYLVNVDAKEVYHEEVYAIGKDFFLLRNAHLWKPCWREIRFNEYGERWFFEFEDAKAFVERYLKDNEMLEEGGDDWWVTRTL